MPKAQPSPYVKPVQGKIGRTDQGVDFQGTPGDSVVAIGDAHVDAVKSDPGGFGQAIYYTLTNGPMKGQQFYVGHAQPTVKAGDNLNAGDAVATLLQHPLGNATAPGWTEIGFASNGAPAVSAGPAFRQFYNSLGSYRGPTGLPDPSQTDVGSQSSFMPMTTPSSPSDVQTVQGPDLIDGGVSSLWQQIASQPFASPETNLFAQNSALATNQSDLLTP